MPLCQRPLLPSDYERPNSVRAPTVEEL